MKKMKLLVLFVGVLLSLTLTLTFCKKESKEDPVINDYAVAEAQLKKDYVAYNVGKISWSTQRGFQIAAFTTTTKAQGQSITAWYKVSGESATREMDSEDLGTTVPDKIKAAFNATKYSDAQLWRIEEIELEHNYNGNGIESYYEMELQSIINQKLEAELFFSFDTGALLYAKEDLDDDDDSDDDRFVINDQLVAAVEAVFPGAKIIDAEVDDGYIEVEALVISDGMTKEVELKFTMGYVLVSSETETEYRYSQLPEAFDVVNEWFVVNSDTAPIPPPNTEVEITAGDQSESDYNIGKYYYEVEIDDYDNGGKEYEVEFYLTKDYEIIAVIVNDRRH